MLSFFYVNDIKNVDVKCLNYEMYFCYNSMVLVCNVKIEARKGLILYNITNGIKTLKNYVNVDHSIIAKMFKEKMNDSLKREVEKQPTKKKPNTSSNAIVNFLLLKLLSKKIICNNNFFKGYGFVE